MLTNVGPLLEGRRMVICAGSGGVGKTTTAAAVGLGLAEQGLKVAVVTIDPARRLANALGLQELDNEPRRVELDAPGELWAMMLDAKRTFDQLIEHLAPDEKTRDEVLANRIYQQLSSAVAGSQEFTAIAKLYELDRDGDYDVLVLDTPPSRNALDFLDAPGRLTGFFQGRAIRVFMRPAGISGRILGRGTGVVFGILQRVTGVDLLRDLSVFFRSLGGMIDGFTERAKRVGALLEDPATTFLIVTAPRHDPVEEAIFFHRKLREASMPFGGLVVNRVHQPPDDALGTAVATELGPALAERVSVATRELAALAARDAANVQRLRDELGDPPTILVPELEDDVHDLDGLALVRSHLFQ
ncbi:AAA family ATPase [Solirubrobacter ginsenosidimutans]|uniref:AAA family ATPase n=1 Tax=Solirubrobacter ginsenosidimutans TaxID=490573 RepID=A0A9X3MYP2_9ACTN|nr:ArsA-related P-loop ATPase [Solirubrobacter ginsenosidimutans]MDA0165426.1 AAA family ATPase [Solirubrobacter ginsenosidimutans]